MRSGCCARSGEASAGKRAGRRTLACSGHVCWDFHCRVAEAAHNPVLNIVVNALDESIREPISHAKLTREMRYSVLKSHRDILEALRSGDGVSAAKAMSSTFWTYSLTSTPPTMSKLRRDQARPWNASG